MTTGGAHFAQQQPGDKGPGRECPHDRTTFWMRGRRRQERAAGPAGETPSYRLSCGEGSGDRRRKLRSRGGEEGCCVNLRMCVSVCKNVCKCACVRVCE